MPLMRAFPILALSLSQKEIPRWERYTDLSRKHNRYNRVTNGTTFRSSLLRTLFSSSIVPQVKDPPRSPAFKVAITLSPSRVGKPETKHPTPHYVIQREAVGFGA